MNWNNLELPDNPYYQDNAVLIYHGDCREILPQLPKVDLVLTDMPYEDVNFGWLDDCFGLLRDAGSCYVITDYRSVAELKLTLDGLGIFRNWIVWCYRGIARRGSFFQRNHDDVLFYTKSNDYTWNQPYEPPSESTMKRWGKYADKEGNIPLDKLTPSMRKRHKSMSIRETRMRDWWVDIPVVGYGEAPTGKLHDYQKPTALIERIISASSNEGDLILDPFLGSGTTAYCAKKLNRKCIGIEIEERYAEIAAKRCCQSVMNFDPLKERRR